MIQELLGVVEERKISIPGGLLIADGSSSPSLSSSSQSSMSSSSSSEPQQSLRCPRCDSPNTKFCYYNNYNLTQPRHFCKTCRRYWTKGGALRNVPIGGGCRKAKPTPAAAVIGGRSGGVKPKPASPDFAGRMGGHEQELPSSPVLWATPYSSHLLALLRASQFQNPNPNPIPNLNSIQMKEEGVMAGSHMAAEAAEQTLSLDHLGQLAVGPSNSLWRNGGQYQYHHQQHQQQQQQQQLQQQQQQQQQHNMLLGEVQSSGIQELLQRLRSSSSGNYHNCHGQLPMVMSNVGSAPADSSAITTATMATSSSASILEPIPLSGGELGYWNPAFSWSDLPTTNGAFP